MRIAKIDIESFRGIPGHCSLDFRDKFGNACSAIIYGGNGCGKSSIIDAIEFNLQGKIERSESLKDSTKPSVLNICYKQYQTAHTAVEFDDGSVFVRDIQVIFDQITNSYRFERDPHKSHESFNHSPIALRRNDIIKFHICPVQEKQVLLSESIYNFHTDAKTKHNPIVREWEEEKTKIKNEIRSLLEQIKSIITIDNEEIRKNINNSLVNYLMSRYTITGKIEYSKSGRLKQPLQQTEYFKVVEIAKRIDEQTLKIKELKKKLKDSKPNVSDKDNKFEKLFEKYEKVALYLSDAFKEISNTDYVDSIAFSVADISATSFDIEVTLKNGRKEPPERIFSEANYDLMILLLYISMIRVGSEMGQEKVLVLDDVLQSVDSTIRTRFMAYVLREFCDWQLFITCHDRAWLNQLRYLFNNLEQGGYHPYKEFDIIDWSFDTGPIVQENKESGIDNRLIKAIETNNIYVIAATAGPFFEMICDKLTANLHSSINRNTDDRYTISDLWKGLSKSLMAIGLEKEVNDIDRFKFVRNMISCHSSSWAEAISDFEIRKFAEAVQTLYEKTFCHEKGCMSWIQGKYNCDKSCNCRKLSYQYRRIKKEQIIGTTK